MAPQHLMDIFPLPMPRCAMRLIICFNFFILFGDLQILFYLRKKSFHSAKEILDNLASSKFPFIFQQVVSYLIIYLSTLYFNNSLKTGQ
jgi:hypothetical protein